MKLQPKHITNQGSLKDAIVPAGEDVRVNGSDQGIIAHQPPLRIRQHTISQ